MKIKILWNKHSFWISSNKILLSILSSTLLLKKNPQKTKQTKKWNLKNSRNKICLLRMRQKDTIGIGLIFYLLLIGIIIFPALNINISPPLELWCHLCWEEHIIIYNICMAPVPASGAFADALRSLSPRLSKMLVSIPLVLATDSSSGDGFI